MKVCRSEQTKVLSQLNLCLPAGEDAARRGRQQCGGGGEWEEGQRSAVPLGGGRG